MGLQPTNSATSEQAMTPLQAIKTCLTKSFQFSGRASRAEFWWFLPLPILITVFALYNAGASNEFGSSAAFFILQSVLFPMLSFILIAAGTRRLIDAGSRLFRFFQAGLLIVLAAYVGLIYFVIALKLFSGASSESVMVLGGIAIFICLPVASLLLLCFAVPLAYPSKPGPNRYGPNPNEVQS